MTPPDPPRYGLTARVPLGRHGLPDEAWMREQREAHLARMHELGRRAGRAYVEAVLAAVAGRRTPPARAGDEGVRGG